MPKPASLARFVFENMASMHPVLILIILCACVCICSGQSPDYCDETTPSTCVYKCPTLEESCSILLWDQTTHNPLRTGNHSYCCPGYFLTSKGVPVCQICNGVTYMAGINDCTCSCYLCKDCDYPSETDCTRTSNTVCRNETAPTGIRGTTCPLMNLTTSTPQTPAPPVMSTTKGTNQSENAVPEQRGSTSYLVPAAIGGSIVMAIILVLFISILSCCCCWLHRLAADGREVPEDQPDNGRQSLKAALVPLAKYLFRRQVRAAGNEQDNRSELELEER